MARKLLEFADDKLEQLHNMFAKIPSLTDDDIAAGIQLSEEGLAKIQRRLGVDRATAELLISKLRNRLHSDDLIKESAHPRYSFEQGFLNDVTVFDSQTGHEIILSGSRGSDFLNSLTNGNPQAVMARFFNKPLAEDDAPASSFDSEMAATSGSFNFPWTIGSQFGFACASYSGRGPELKINIISAVDSHGRQMKLGPVADQLKIQAKAKIDDI